MTINIFIVTIEPNNFTNAGGNFTLQERFTVCGHPDEMILDIMNRVGTALILRHTLSSEKDIITENNC
jgi:hypothetical protein